MKMYYSKKRIIIILSVFICLIAVLSMSWFLASQSGVISYGESGLITQHIQNWVGSHFSINRADPLWHGELHILLRKFAHFLEYMVIGTLVCTLLNLLFRKMWLAAAATVVLCPILGIIDEYRQKFISGRTSKLSDVTIDSCGAILGVILVTLLFLVMRKIGKRKERTADLEERQSALGCCER